MPIGIPDRLRRFSTPAAPYHPGTENYPPDPSGKRFIKSLLFIGKILTSLFLILLLAAPGERSSAQAPGLVRVSPETASVAIGGEVTLSLEVLGAEDVNAYDLTLRYDPAYVTLTSWSHGDYLANLAQVYKIEEPGTLRLVFTQLATPPVSGDGVLLYLAFSGAAVGESAVVLEKVDFAGGSGGIVNPDLQDGLLAVIPAPTATPPPTETLPPVEPSTTAPLPSLTATAVGQLSASLTPTAAGPAALDPSRTPTFAAKPPASAPTSLHAMGNPTTASQSPDQSGIFLPAVESGADAAEQADSDRDYRLVNTLLWILLGILAAVILWLAWKLIHRQPGKS